MSETLVFGILVGCLHYYKCLHCKILRIFFGDRPFKPPTMFFMFFLMAQIFRKAFRIVGLDGGKCRRVVEQDFHRNFRTWICGFFSLPFFSHLFSFLHFFKQTYRLIVFLHALYFLLNHHVELIHKNFTFT